MTKIYTFTGASGTGKTTIVRELVANHDFAIVQSVTTRVRRLSDISGEYLHLELNDFADLEKKGDFLWTTPIVHGNRYGTLRSSVDLALAGNKNAAMILIPEVIQLLRNYVPLDKLQHFYVLSPPAGVLAERLTKRGDEQKDIEKRIRECLTWDEEAKKSIVPYVFITNSGTKEETVKEVLKYIA